MARQNQTVFKCEAPDCDHTLIAETNYGSAALPDGWVRVYVYVGGGEGNPGEEIIDQDFCCVSHAVPTALATIGQMEDI